MIVSCVENTPRLVPTRTSVMSALGIILRDRVARYLTPSLLILTAPTLIRRPMPSEKTPNPTIRTVVAGPPPGAVLEAAKNKPNSTNATPRTRVNSCACSWIEPPSSFEAIRSLSNPPVTHDACVVKTSPVRALPSPRRNRRWIGRSWSSSGDRSPSSWSARRRPDHPRPFQMIGSCPTPRFWSTRRESSGPGTSLPLGLELVQAQWW